MKKDNKSEAAVRLREKAEELLKKKPLKAGAQISKADTQRLVHELEVHQIELELENEELKLAKAQAEISSEKFTELYDFAPTGYFTLSKEGEIIELNLSGAKMLRHERSRLVNRGFGLYVSEDTRQVFTDFLRKVFESNTKESCEVALSTDGNSPMHIYITGIVTENSKHCLMTTVEITERKREEEKLRESERFLKETQIIAKLGIYTMDITSGKWVSSEVLDTIWGIDSDFDKSVEGWASIIHPEWQKIMTDYFIQEVVGNKTKFDKEYIIIRKNDKEERWVHGLGRLEFDDNNQPITMIGTIQDITERKKSEENLRKLNAEKDKFFSIIAHDLRSPFNGFLGLTEIMAEGLQDLTLEEIQRIAVSLKNSAVNLYSLLGNLLEWSLMQRGLTAFEPQLFLLMPKITESIALVTAAADKKEIAIKYDIPEDLTVFADRNMFEAVIRNLSSNAVKFTNKGGVVNVSAKTMPDNSVEISIKDTGIGMDKEMINNLFRIDIDTSRKGTEDESSTGLGLIICKDFIEKHGGKLRAESEEGKGSLFTFTIPENVQSNAGEYFNAVLRAEHSGEIKDLKILIAEDDEKSDRLLKLLIKTITKEVLHAKTGIEAVEACRNNPDIDVVLMDIIMPGTDGYEATRQIRKFNKNVIIIAQTAYALIGDREKAIEAGCNDYILKPIIKGEIISMIKKCIGERE
ncbi:MAG: ATP-binding protein [Ignavibacteriae bacterium]|nr:ATP-binding protein [Ignavibacteriota bacterium]